MDGVDFVTFAAQGNELPWSDDLENHPGFASYFPPYKRRVYPTPEESPVRLWQGWQSLDDKVQEVVGAIYAPDRDESGRWGCIIACPAVFGSNKRISGVDAEQSLELAEWLLIDQWNHHNLQPKLDQIELTYAARFR